MNVNLFTLPAPSPTPSPSPSLLPCSRPSARSCRIKLVAFHAASWQVMANAEAGDFEPLPAGIVALPEDLANAISDGQLSLFP